MTPPSGSKWAVLLGASIGGLWAVIGWERPAPAPSPPAAPEPAVPVALSPPSSPPASGPETSNGQASLVASATRLPAPAEPPITLLSSPHETELGSAREVQRAEVRCIENKDGDACVQASDAFAAGKVVPADEKRAKRYASIARTHYVSQCDGQSSLACQRLSLLYRTGDGVRQSTWAADELLARARDHCHLRKNREFCAALEPPAHDSGAADAH